MAKTIVIRQHSWLERHPVQIRRLLVRLIFSEATQHGWDVRMDGQRWRDADGNMASYRHTHDRQLTDQEWIMIMGHVPS